MSSRSNPPKPTTSSWPESGVGGSGGTLSNDALYAPLSTYADVTSSSSSSAKNDNNNTKKKSSQQQQQQQQQQHSLSIQASSSLRESSLITFLSSMSQSLKTSHLHEYALYRGMGGSIAKFGMGDTDRGSNAMRGQFESKLLNRSLILVGGGVHNKVSSTKDTIDTSGGKNDMSIVSGMGMASRAAATSGKRERGRVGGNGIFGSISNKKRKKLLTQISVEKKKRLQQQSKEKKEECQFTTIHHDGDVEQIIDKSLQKDTEQSQSEQQSKSDAKLNGCNKIKHNTAQAEVQQKEVGSVIETLHKMWLSYIQQLLTCIPTSSSVDSSATASLSLEGGKHISHIVATAEHVGMHVSIVECPSRRHLVNARCIIIDETKETYKIAMIKSIHKEQRQMKNNKKKMDAKQIDGSTGDSIKKDSKNEENVVLPHHTWIIALVPKRGTVLEIDLPWVSNSVRTNITVRLET